jgi:hypothetical protein
VGERFFAPVQRLTQQLAKLVPSPFPGGIVTGICFDLPPPSSSEIKGKSPLLSLRAFVKKCNSSAYYMLVHHNLKSSILIVFGEGGESFTKSSSNIIV